MIFHGIKLRSKKNNYQVCELKIVKSGLVLGRPGKVNLWTEKTRAFENNFWVLMFYFGGHP